MVRAVNFINWPIGKILAYGAAFGPRHVAGGGPRRGSPGECGNGPSRGRPEGVGPAAGYLKKFILAQNPPCATLSGEALETVPRIAGDSKF